MKRLGELLRQQNLIDDEQLAEALEAQVVYGGRLGTNLLELGYLKEIDLARTLGHQHQLPYAFGDMVPDPRALALASHQFYDDEDVLPMRLEPSRLVLAVLGPQQLKAADALSFRASKKVVMVVIPEFRMNQLLRQHCAAVRSLRPLDVNQLRPSTRVQKESHETEKAGAAMAELMGEAEFAKLYADATLGKASRGAVAVTVAQNPEPLPLSFAQAQQFLKEHSHRDDIAQTVLRFARSKFQRALLLNVQGELVTGWKGLGTGIDARTVRGIAVSLREDNTFRLVSGLQSHFIGPMKRTPGMAVFYELLGGGFPQTAIILPLLLRTKLVHLLYVDAGPGEVTPPDLGELLILAQGVARSYEALIRQRSVH